MGVLTKTPSPPSRDSVQHARDAISRHMDIPAAWFELDNLEAREQSQLVELAARVYRQEPGRADRFGVEPPHIVFDRDALNAKEWKSWLRLVAKACGRPDWFKNKAAEAQLQVEIAKADRAMNPPRKRVSYEEPGAVILPQRVIEDVKAGALPIQSLGVLAFFLLILENREAITHDSRFEGDWFCFAREFVTASAGLGGVDFGQGAGAESTDIGHGSVCKVLEHLAGQPEAYRWLEIDKRGLEWRVRLGPAALKAYERRSGR
jgi:hypothetical protein